MVCRGADLELRYTRTTARVVCFGRLAEIVSQYLAKGSYVYLEGRIQTRQYTDPDATQRSVTEMIAHDMRTLDAAHGNSDQV